MAKSPKSQKRGPGRPAYKGPAILLALKANPGSTATELGANMPMILSLRDKGYLVKSGHRQTGTRGRPQSEYRLTLPGHSRVRSILSQQAKVQQDSPVAVAA
jgi:hypothetical protein